MEVTDGDMETNAGFRGTLFYDLAKFLPMRIAMDMAEELREKAKEVREAVKGLPEQATDPDYWCQQLRHTVRVLPRGSFAGKGWLRLCNRPTMTGLSGSPS